MRTARCCCLWILAALTGCTVGPEYDPPAMEIPCEWHSPLSDGMQLEAPDCFLWWESLNDPVLNSLIERAAVQNLDLYIAATRILEVRAVQKGKSASAWPRLDGSATFGHVHYDKDKVNHILGTKLHHNHIDFFEVGFDAEWEIDLFGMNAHEIKALQAKVESIEEKFCHLWVTLAAEVARNYVELRGIQLRLGMVENHIEIQRETFRLTEDLVNNGFITDVELKMAEKQLSLMFAQKSQLKLSISQAIHRLSILLNYAPGELHCELIEPEELPCLPCEKPIGIPSELLRRRPDIRSAERELAAATEQVGTAIAALFPRLSLRGFIGDIGSLCSGGSFSWFGGSQLLAPIFNSKLLREDVNLNKIKTQRALYKYQKVILTALEEAENAIASLHFESERSDYLQKAERSSQEAYQMTVELYHKGLKNYLDVLENHRSLISVQESNLDSQIQLLIHYISLYKALGGGW